MESINPFTGKVVARYEEMSRDVVGAAIEAAHRAHLEWREQNFAERARPMKRAAELLRNHAAE
jgi:succinate-semialdehyde dehydrogenase/glutarate-semialdehyde dehydrogenase